MAGAFLVDEAVRQNSGTQPRLTFNGQQTDGETGLVYLRARYYDPSVGRFQTKDPVQGCAGQPVTLNGYTYARNNPATFVDPKGTWEYEPGASGGGGSSPGELPSRSSPEDAHATPCGPDECGMAYWMKWYQQLVASHGGSVPSSNGGETSCDYYNNKCAQGGLNGAAHDYYCTIAPFVCGITGNTEPRMPTKC